MFRFQKDNLLAIFHTCKKPARDANRACSGLESVAKSVLKSQLACEIPEFGIAAAVELEARAAARLAAARPARRPELG